MIGRLPACEIGEQSWCQLHAVFCGNLFGRCARSGDSCRAERKLARGEEVRAWERRAAPLCCRINGADALDLIAEPLHTQWLARPRREEVKNAAASRKLAATTNEWDALVAECRHTVRCIIKRHAHTRLHQQ